MSPVAWLEWRAACERARLAALRAWPLASGRGGPYAGGVLRHGVKPVLGAQLPVRPLPDRPETDVSEARCALRPGTSPPDSDSGWSQGWSRPDSDGPEQIWTDLTGVIPFLTLV